MPEQTNERLATFYQRLQSEPSFAFLADLTREHPQSHAYLVGGIVRDVQLGREAKDYDVVVRGVPSDALRAFLETHGAVNLVGRNFGVFKFRPHGWPNDGDDIDIALPRTEHAEGTGGYRDVAVQSDHMLAVEDDLGRRDFTINAMAIDLRSGALIDPFDGRADLEHKTIRAVDSPQERFTEDRSRMLRALRFAAQLGFTIEANTMDAIRVHMPRINEQRATEKAHPMTTLLVDTEYVTPRETVACELVKSFVGDPVRSLDLWDEAGAIAQLLPELVPMKGCEQPSVYHSEGDVWEHTRRALAVLRSEQYRREFGDEQLTALVVFGVLLHDIGKPPTQRTPEQHDTDRIRFDGHDREGGAMSRALARRLALASAFPRGHRHHVDAEDLGMVIDHHLLLLADPTTMRNATIERYFFNPLKPGDAMQRVAFCDGSASIPQGATEADLAHFRALRKRIADIAALRDEAARLPTPVLNGKEIMEHCALPPSPRIGELKEALREEQLRIALAEHREMSKEEARAFLTTLTP